MKERASPLVSLVQKLQQSICPVQNVQRFRRVVDEGSVKGGPHNALKSCKIASSGIFSMLHVRIGMGKLDASWA